MMALKKCRNMFGECMTTVFIFIACKVGLINWNTLYKSSTMKLQAVFPSETVLPNKTIYFHNANATVYANKMNELMNIRKNNRLFILWSLSTRM